MDTNVLKHVGRAQPNKNVEKWLKSVSDQNLFISAISVTEVQKGITEKAKNKDPKKAADAVPMQQALDAFLSNFAGRILPLDTAAAKEWGRRRAKHGTKNDLDLAIISIVATQAGAAVPQVVVAQFQPSTVVVTQNLADFRHRGIAVLNPFDDPPSVYQDPET